MPAKELRENFSEAISRVAYGKERIIVRRHNKDVVGVVPVDDLRLLEKLEELLDVHDAASALAESEIQGSLTLVQLRTELGL
jgi:prevent-host-death family protein